MPATFYKPHARLEYDLSSDPPKLICCVAIWVPANEKLNDTAPTTLTEQTIIRYAVDSNGTDPNDHWEHFRFEWSWDDFRTKKYIINNVGNRASLTNSSDRAEPY